MVADKSGENIFTQDIQGQNCTKNDISEEEKIDYADLSVTLNSYLDVIAFKLFHDTSMVLVDGFFFPEKSTYTSTHWRFEANRSLHAEGNLLSTVALEHRHIHTAEIYLGYYLY